MRIIYSESYANRAMAVEQLKALYAKLKSKVSPWNVCGIAMPLRSQISKR
ncbi:MAG: hypothetical protein ACLTW9_29600 [Enterocloster sp.]